LSKGFVLGELDRRWILKAGALVAALMAAAWWAGRLVAWLNIMEVGGT